MTALGRTQARRYSPIAVINEVTLRAMRRMRRRPSLFVPAVVMPLFFAVTFTGSFSGITDSPGFPTDNAWDWMTIYAILQGAAFAGQGTAGMTAEDIENGFFDRMLLAPGPRLSLLLGSLNSAVQRAAIPTTCVLLVALTVGGATMRGGVLGVVVIYLAAAGCAVLFGLCALIAAYIGKTQRSLMAVQVVVFAAMFLSIGQVPLDFLDGWLYQVARVNPVTNILRMGRQGFLGSVTWDLTWPGLVAIVAPSTVLGLVALDRLRRFAD